MRRIEHEQIEARARAAEQPRIPAIEIRQVQNFLRSAQRLHDIGVSRNERTRLDRFRLQGDRQRSRHVGEAAGFNKGKDLRGNAKDTNRIHAFNPSIIGCVIRQMPCAVTRKRFASSSGSSPTTSPSGIRTPRSITTFFSRALRATLTYGSTTAFSTLAKECRCTPVNNSERRSEAPEMMHPPDTSDVTASPRRPSSSWTNFAGGV